MRDLSLRSKHFFAPNSSLDLLLAGTLRLVYRPPANQCLDSFDLVANRLEPLRSGGFSRFRHNVNTETVRELPEYQPARASVRLLASALRTGG
jgi:hypothetical protein